MTREEQLWSMTMVNLVSVADKLGIKIDKKGAKAKAIEKIMAAETGQKSVKIPKAPKQGKIKTQEEFLNAVSDVLDDKTSKKTPNSSIKAPETPKPNKTTTEAKNEPKRSNLRLTELTYKGKTKSIKEWAAEIGMPWPTLYDRVNRNGWPVDLAIETPLGQRRPKA